MADRRLQVFHAVARLLSFTKAAEVLRTTQSAISFQVRQLEEHFNARLFDRMYNSISLTEAGRQVYEYADRIFGLHADMESAVREMTGDTDGHLALGATTTLAGYVLPALLGDFKARHPNITVHLKASDTEGVMSMVEDSVIDLGVVGAPVTNKHLVIAPCRIDQLVVIAPPRHPLAQHAQVTAAQLLEYPFICREEGSGTCEVIRKYIAACGLSHGDMNVCMELGSPEAIKSAVEAGFGVSIVSRTTVAKELRLGSLAAVPLDPPLERPFSFVHRRRKSRARLMDALMDFARHYCQTH